MTSPRSPSAVCAESQREDTAPIQIDVVIPTYNRAALVGRAIESALAQSRAPDRVIVVDDGSTDATPEVVRSYGDRVSYLRTPHHGVAAARNAAVAESDAEFVAFLDSDDTWLPDHLERLADAVADTAAAAWLYFSDLRLGADRDEAETIWNACSFGVEGDLELRRDAVGLGLSCRDSR